MNDEFEVLWMQCAPPPPPLREIQSIIVGTVYHPPSTCKLSMRNYLYESMSRIKAQFSDCGVILLGDFNKMDLSRIANAFGVKQVVPFPTREQSKLDLVFTSLNAFYDVPKKLPPFGLSDHATVEVQPLEREKLHSQKIVLQSRDLRATKRLAMRIYLEEVDVCSLVGSLQTCQKKTDTLETVLKTGMDILLPLTLKNVMTNDPPWINKQLKSLIHQRQVAFARGDLVSFRSLRNRVSRLRKSYHAKYYASKVGHLRNCKPRTWWKGVKTLGGMKSATRTDLMSVLSTLIQSIILVLLPLLIQLTRHFLRP